MTEEVTREAVEAAINDIRKCQHYWLPESIEVLIAAASPATRIRRGEAMNFISREQTIAVIKNFNWSCGREKLLRLVESLFSFPAPNPEGRGGRNVMGQTEDEFWALVDKQDAQHD